MAFNLQNLISGGAQVYDYTKTQDTAREGAKEARQAAEQGISTTKEYLDPFAKAGVTATQDYLSLLKDPSSVRQDPGYEFQQQEQQRAIERSAAAKGQGVISGGTLATLQQRSGDLASLGYDKALKRRLDLIGPGQQAAESASGTIASLQGDIGQAAIDREEMQLANRGRTVSGLTGLMESMQQPGVGGGGGQPGGGGGGVPIVGDWSLSDIPQALQAGAHEVGDFFDWMKDPNTSIFDPSSWDMPSFEGIADYSINDFFGDLGFL